MITHTEAIVLKTIKYGESSLIVKTYSKEYGLLSIITGTNGKKSKKFKNYFNALNILNLTIYFKEKQNLHRLKDVNYNDKNIEIGNHIGISAIKFFIAEILNKIIAEEEVNIKLYDFLKKEIEKLNKTKIGLKYFHLDFLYQISEHLGIKPNFCQEGKFFDLLEGN